MKKQLKLNDIVLPQHKAIIDKVRDKCGTLGLKSFLYGGYVRDSYYGHEPRDIDLIIIKNDYNDKTKKMDQLAKTLANDPLKYFEVTSSGLKFTHIEFDKNDPLNYKAHLHFKNHEPIKFFLNENCLLAQELKWKFHILTNGICRAYCGDCELEFIYLSRKDPDKISVIDVISTLRTDLTIHNIYFDLDGTDIHDVFGYGISDLENKILRCHDFNLYKRFPKRLLSIARFAISRNLTVENSLLQFTKEHGAALVREGAENGINSELKKIFSQPNAAKIVHALHGLDLLRPALRLGEKTTALEVVNRINEIIEKTDCRIFKEKSTSIILSAVECLTS